MRCGLCGYEFESSAETCPVGCPLRRHCGAVCCPKCGYRFIDEKKGRIARLVDRLWPSEASDARRLDQGRTDEVYSPNGKRRGKTREAGDTVPGRAPLSRIAPGYPVRVESLEGLSRRQMVRLSSYGIVPGVCLSLVQERPTPVLRIDETDLAVGPEVLTGIWVRRCS